MEESWTKSFFDEINLLKTLHHPNIVNVYELYMDENNYHMGLELCNGKELFDYIVDQKQISEKHAAKIIKQLLSALTYMHSKKISHSDLKPENVMVQTDENNEVNVKIIDFGNAIKLLNGDEFKKVTYTAFYSSPDMIKHKQCMKNDIWSLGVMLYIMLSGMPPFVGKDVKTLDNNIINKKVEFNGNEWANVSNEVKELIEKMLIKSASKRISAKECIKHSWFDEYSDEDNDINLEIFDNLISFRKNQEFQKATLSFISNHLITESDKKEILHLFKSLDLDNNGYLS